MSSTGLLTIGATSQKLYQYVNATGEIQIVYLTDSKNFSSEKLVFPQQRILFEGIPEGRVETYVGKNGIKVLKKVFCCQDDQLIILKEK